MKRRNLEQEVDRLNVHVETLRQACQLVAVGVADPVEVARRALDGVTDQWDPVIAGELERLRSVASSLEADLHESRNLVERTNRRCSELDGETFQLRQNLQQLEQRHDEVCQNRSSLEADVRRLEQQLDETRNLLDAAQRSLDVTAAELEARDRELDDAVRRHAETETRIVVMAGELSAANDAREHAAQSAAQTLQEAERLRVDATFALDQARSTVDLVARLAASLAASRHMFGHDRDTRTRILNDGGRILDEARRWLQTVTEASSPENVPLNQVPVRSVG